MIREEKKLMYNVEKVWSHKSNTCVVIMTDVGHRCGYVGITSAHPLYGIEYSDNIPKTLLQHFDRIKEGPVGKRGVIDLLVHDPESPRVGILFDVHGGITFSEGDEKYPIEMKDIWWFGYDCAHTGDGRDMNVVSPDQREYLRNLPGDIVRSLKYCVSECESLSGQLEELL